MATVRPGHHPATTTVLLFLLLACPTLQQFQASPLHPRPLSDDDFFQVFLRWTHEFERIYKSFLDQQHRFNIFRDNLLHILDTNEQEGLTYKLGLNNFTDLTRQEFQAQYLGLLPTPELMRSAPDGTRFVYADVKAKDAVDWRNEGAVTGVKNQGSCGSCWTFSATGAVEGVYKIKKGQLVSLSEQQLLDCCTSSQCSDCSVCSGCNGGSMYQAFLYVKANGLHTEKDYPYKMSTSFQCKNPSAPVVHIDDVAWVPCDNQVGDNFLKAVTMQPVSVGINADTDFQYYTGGIFNGACSNSPNHGVLVVGYGKSNDGTKYWIVKNSWGTSWGEGGYIRLPRGTDGQNGKCSINTMVSFPTIKGSSKESRFSI